METDLSGVGHAPLLSIIMPAWNAERYLRFALDSVFAQTLDSGAWELIVVDDCSTDGTCRELEAFADKANLRVARTLINSGPGIARNLGVDMARGEWLVFLDSDDRLLPTALAELKQEIERSGTAECDLIAYNWGTLDSSASTAVPVRGLRRDHAYLLAGREELIRRYLRLQTDGSVIFSAVRRRLVLQHPLRFAAGLHEDVDYLFFLYWYARGYRFIDKVLYGKTQRSDSIVNTFTELHIAGFLRAWRAIGRFLSDQQWGVGGELLDPYLLGVLAVVATRVREIFRSAERGSAPELCRFLFERAEALKTELGLPRYPDLNTRYGMLARSFFDTMKRHDLTDAAKADAICGYLADLQSKTWSCTDLQHSVFLGPNQIRTCCKRFFHEGEMRGDVVLLNLSPGHAPGSDDIAAAKHGLIDALNRGDRTVCDGCPFLEFKAWEPLEPLNLHYLSLEYHSVCNLKCSYCSETYYGGARATYDVQALIEEFIARGQLTNGQTVVWGGGEPVVDPAFTPLIERLIAAVPGAIHRVLTNSVKFSPTVERLLAEDRISITTSVDAGSAETFKRVRGRARLDQVMSNLKKYAAQQPRRVTVKYIFTEVNSTLEEVRGFVDLIGQYDLRQCNFQISSNFKEEHITLETAVLMIAMYGLLAQAGIKVIFFDDLLRLRLGQIHADFAEEIRGHLRGLGLEGAIARSQETPRLVIWGAGLQARYLLENSAFLREAKVEFFVDDTPGKAGTSYLGYEVRPPEVLRESDLPVLIAAVQGYPIIYNSFLRLGVDESRLISGLVL